MISAAALLAIAATVGAGRDGPLPELFGEGVISTPDDELGITFTRDGNTAYFTKRTPTTNTAPRLVICVSQRAGGRWSEPRVAPFSGTFNDFGPTISPDGARMFFSSDRPVPGRASAAGVPPDVDLWVMERTATGTGWSEPRNLGAPLNSPAAAEQYASVAADGTLYFSSNRAGGKGSFDLYRSRLVAGRYGEPENLGELNSAAYEGQPCIAPDQSFIVFTAIGRDDALHGEGVQYPRGDLYLSVRGASGAWSAPRNLGVPINSPAAESNPSLSPDGKWLFFTSERSPFTVPMPHRISARALMAQLRTTLSGSGNIYRIAASTLRRAAPGRPETRSTAGRLPAMVEAEEPAPPRREAAVLPLSSSGLPPPYAVTTPLTEPRLFGEGIISTAADEFGGQFTGDGRTLFFNRSVPRSQLYTILVSTFDRGHWSPPEVAPFSGVWRDFDPVLSPDGARLFFISDRPAGGQPTREYAVWALDRKADGSWSEPWRLPEPINLAPGDPRGGSAHFISATRDGTLYFTSTRQGNLGRVDVYRTRREGGRYTPAENLGPAINGPGLLNLEAIVAPDESFLIVSVYGRADSLGDSDLYVSYRQDGTWLPLQSLGPGVNSAARDYSPRLSPDGRYLFFASERGLPTDPRSAPFTYRELTDAMHSIRNGLGNLYQIDLAASLPPLANAPQSGPGRGRAGGGRPVSGVEADGRATPHHGLTFHGRGAPGTHNLRGEAWSERAAHVRRTLARRMAGHLLRGDD
jgi:Tol biopolymer transport system component